LEITGFSDSDFVGCQDSLKSTLGYIFMLAGGAVFGAVSNKPLQLHPPWQQNL